MCRIFFSPSNDIGFTPEDLTRFLDVLEKAGGRDGNGYYSFTQNKIIKTMPPNTTIDVNGGFLYHTRLGTNGKKAIYNVQPIESDNYVLVHNGVYSSVDAYARCLGFYWSDKKYSDSYMMSYIVEKIGILRFYITLHDKYFGVVLIYDKNSKRTYLLKGSGTFQGAQLKSSKKWIYASQSLDFWAIDEETKIDFDRGLFLIKEDGYIEIMKPKTTTYNSRYNSKYDTDYDYNYGYRNRYGNNKYTYDGTVNSNKKKKKKHGKNLTPLQVARIKEKFMRDRLPSDSPATNCSVCRKSFENGGRKFKNYGYTVCENCYDKFHEYDCDEQFKEIEDEEPVGLASLFPINIPTYCNGCNWLINGLCHFGGIERDKFPLIKGVKKGISYPICNTKDQKIDFLLHCNDCGKKLRPDDSWAIRSKDVLCKKCAEKPIKIPDSAKTCGNCRYRSTKAQDEPCKTCKGFFSDQRDYWRPFTGDDDTQLYDCDSCHYTDIPSNVEPCRSCQLETDYTAPDVIKWKRWTPIGQGDPDVRHDYEVDDYDGEIIIEKCYYCGYHFVKGMEEEEGEEIEPIYDKNGHRICGLCDDAEYYIDEEVQQMRHRFG